MKLHKNDDWNLLYIRRSGYKPTMTQSTVYPLTDWCCWSGFLPTCYLKVFWGYFTCTTRGEKPLAVVSPDPEIIWGLGCGKLLGFRVYCRCQGLKRVKNWWKWSSLTPFFSDWVETTNYFKGFQFGVWSVTCVAYMKANQSKKKKHIPNRSKSYKQTICHTKKVTKRDDKRLSYPSWLVILGMSKTPRLQQLRQVENLPPPPQELIFCWLPYTPGFFSRWHRHTLLLVFLYKPG